MLAKIEAYESRHSRINDRGKQNHEEHIADRGYNTKSLYNLVDLAKPVPQAMTTPEAKLAIDKEWDKFKSEKQTRSNRGSTHRKQNNARCNFFGLIGSSASLFFFKK